MDPLQLRGVGPGLPRWEMGFAISLLLRGAELPNVSILLGHSSTRVTERHYPPWVKARQEKLAADVRLTWLVPPPVGTTGRARTPIKARRKRPK